MTYFSGTQRSTASILLIITIAIYLLQLVPTYGGIVTYFGAMIPDRVLHGEVWRLLTAVFLHSPSTIFHILFNMFALWMFGRILEWRWGSRKFLWFYLITGVAASSISCFSYTILGQNILAIGASGAIMALFVMFALYYPYEKLLFFFLIPIEARFAIPILAFLSLYLGFSEHGAGIDHFGHLGGIIAGLIYYRKEHQIDAFFATIRDRIKAPFMPKPDNVYSFKEGKSLVQQKEQEIEEILRKVSRDGVDALTADERTRLIQYSEQLKSKK